MKTLYRDGFDNGEPMAKKYVIGIDIGGTNVRTALIGLDGNIVSKVKNAAGKEPLSVLNKHLDALYAPNAREICGIGIAVAGLVGRNGAILKSPNIPKLNDVNLRSEIRKRFRTCVEVENDANAAACGEKASGAGKELSDFVMLTLGTGIGGGVVAEGSLLPVAAEVGHMSINAEGPQCPCGNVGCLELYASATAIVGNAASELEKGKASMLRDAYNGNFYKLTAEDIYRAALEGDSLARTILREAGKCLGVGIANVINIFSPEAVILTGGLIGAWNLYIEFAIKEASKRALKELYDRVKIIPSVLGDDAGIIGAANLVFEKCKS